jgi:phosphate acetyltransferase
MSIIDEIKKKAHASIKRIVLPEGDEPRTIRAAARLRDEELVFPILLGDPGKVLSAARSYGVDLREITIINPSDSPDCPRYARLLYELRREKGMTFEKACVLAADPMYYAVLMVKCGDADGLVSGASHTTGDMLRPALQIIKTKAGTKLVSSSLLVECPKKDVGQDGLLIFSDCVVVPCPTAEELAHIAVSAADTAHTLCGIELPKVALLSFSTKGSASHELVSKVRQAVEIAHSLAPDLLLDGELQLDAALVPEVAALKAKDSPVAGSANVLVFPDLQAGNIGYKLVQRLAGAEAFAVLQGLAKPCNDLSRGCSVDDIINTVSITAVQAQA